METKTEYKEPVAKLLEIGEIKFHSSWLDYSKYGISADDIPELIKMATDEELNWADSESKEVWGPVHAWRALGQLRAEEAINPLVNLFHDLEESDWVYEDLPDVFAEIGPVALPALAVYLAYPYRDYMTRVAAADRFSLIGLKHPEAKDRAIQILMDQLEKHKENDPTLNSFLINYLLDLKAEKAIELMKAAFESGYVDETVVGLESVYEEFME
ncbi:MAG: HEAT repeat domain-containing protein [Candidatus Latescibacterota bacterium]